MKLVHQACINVFIKEGENAEKIEETLTKLVPLNLEKEKITINKQSAAGLEDKKIMIEEIILTKQKHTTEFLKNLLNNLTSEQKELLLSQAESRLDEHLHFFIRLDKDKLLNNEFEITDSGNCFHIKLSIAAFPAKREVGLEIINTIFQA